MPYPADEDDPVVRRERPEGHRLVHGAVRVHVGPDAAFGARQGEHGGAAGEPFGAGRAGEPARRPRPQRTEREPKPGLWRQGRGLRES